MRIKITVVHNGKIQNFNQGAHESRDEFHGRAMHEAGIPEGDEYFAWEERGHRTPGPCGNLGTKHVRHTYAQDERLPSLFVLVKGKVYAYDDAKIGTWRVAT
jgi:hypothetical protein